MITSPIEELKNYLTIMVEMRRKIQAMHKLTNTFKYLCAEDFVLQHGKEYEPQPLPKKYKLGVIKQCFYNCLKATKRRKNLIYVEGYAQGAVIPVLHSWCVEVGSNKVIELTWPTNIKGSAYFGVAFDLEFRKTTLSCLDDWQNGFPLLKGEISADVWKYKPKSRATL